MKNRRVEVLIARNLRFNPDESGKNPNKDTGEAAPASMGGQVPNAAVADGSHVTTTTF